MKRLRFIGILIISFLTITTTMVFATLTVKDGANIFSGNVGIETSNPQGKLDVSGGNTFVDSLISRGLVNVLGNLTIQGNVGIGVVNPFSLGDGGLPVILQIHKSNLNGTHGSIIELTHAQTLPGYTAGGLVFGTTTTSAGDKRYAGIYSGPELNSSIATYGFLNFIIWNNSSYSSAMYINSSRNVGIGTTSPQCALDVIGTVRANGTTLTSDERLKKNIQPLEKSLDKVLKLRGVSYEWKDEKKGKGGQIGVIAQEIEKEYPELVLTDSEGYKSVAYDKLAAVLIESTKELKSEVQDLKKEIEELKKLVKK